MAARLGIDLRDYLRRLSAIRDELRRERVMPKHVRNGHPCGQEAVDSFSPVATSLRTEILAVDADHRRSSDLRRIEEALQRMAEGRYGYCVTCGEGIGPDRLEDNPTAVLCCNCARLTGVTSHDGK